MRWSPGKYQSGALQSRIKELLGLLKTIVNDHRQAGRFPLADDLEELADAVEEYMRTMENTLEANRASISALEKSIRAQSG